MVMRAVDFGRDVLWPARRAEAREWLCVNGIGGFASGTVAGLATRRYHGLLVAALQPPLGRTVLVSRAEETTEYRGVRRDLHVNRWADGTVGPTRASPDRALPPGRHHPGVERTRWPTRSSRSAIWMEPGANTTYVVYRMARAAAAVALTVAVAGELPGLSRDHARRLVRWESIPWRRACASRPSRGRGPSWCWRRARPPSRRRPGTIALDLARERERGLDSREDTLHAVTFRSDARPGGRDGAGVLRRGGARPGRRGGLAPAAGPRGGGARGLARGAPGGDAGARVDHPARAGRRPVPRQPAGHGRARWEVGDRGLSVVRRLGARHHDRAARSPPHHRPSGGRRVAS